MQLVYSTVELWGQASQEEKKKKNIRWLQMKFLIIEVKKSNFHTFKMSSVSVFGPFEEKAATWGADLSPKTVSTSKI